MKSILKSFIMVIGLSSFIFISVALLANSNITPSDPMKFIQIWVKQSELDKVKDCKIGSPVRIDRSNNEYIVIPCRVVKEIK